MNIFKKISLVVSFFLIVIITFEIFLGYILYQRNEKIKCDNFNLSTIKLFVYFNKSLSTCGLSYFKNLEDKKKNKLNEGINSTNFFIENPPKTAHTKYHPFIDWSNVHGYFFNKNDFFGFRNHNDIFENSKGNYKIIFTGGSECAGFSHKKTISKLIENKLVNNFKSKKIKVYNFCMNSYTLANEMNSLLNFGLKLDPDLIISHSGWNDSLFYTSTPKKFSSFGLIYPPFLETWSEILYSNMDNSLKKQDQKKEVKILNRNIDKDLFFFQFDENLKKFSKLSETFGAKFIFGLQPYNDKYLTKSDYNNYAIINYKELLNNFDRLEVNKINFMDKIQKIVFVDGIHTNSKSAEVISEIYSDYIINNISDEIEKRIY